MQQPPQVMTGLSIADIARGMLRRPLLVLSCLILGGMAGFGIISINKPQYASEAQILVSNLSTPFDRPNGAQLAPLVALRCRKTAAALQLKAFPHWGGKIPCRARGRSWPHAPVCF